MSFFLLSVQKTAAPKCLFLEEAYYCQFPPIVETQSAWQFNYKVKLTIIFIRFIILLLPNRHWLNSPFEFKAQHI